MDNLTQLQRKDNAFAAAKPLFSDKFTKKFVAYDQAQIETAAAETYRAKTFVEKHAAKYKKAVILSYIGAILSMCLAYSFFFELAQNYASNWYVCTGLAVGLVLLIEYAKKELVSDTFEGFFADSTPTVTAVFCVLLIGLSGYTSVLGAKAYTQAQGAIKTDSIAQSTSSAKAAAKSDYKAELQAARADLKEFKNSVMWKGKINSSDKKIMARIAALQAVIAKIQERHDKEIKGIDTGATTATGEALTTTESNSAKMIVFAACNELLILVCIGFTFWFLAGAFKDNNLPAEQQQQAQNTGGFTVHNTAATAAGKTPYNSIRPIGFFNSRTTVESVAQQDDTQCVTQCVEDETTGTKQAVTARKQSEVILNCEHCNNEFERRTVWQKYCTEPCRIAAHELKKGKKLHIKK